MNCEGRLKDVYVGVDVFGRGMIGGGGYNTKEVRKVWPPGFIIASLLEAILL